MNELISHISPLWITLGPLMVINGILFISYLLYQLWGRKRIQRQYAGAKVGDSKFISSSTREWWLWTTDPIVRLFVKLRIGPNALTMIGFLFACGAGVLFGYGSFGYAGWIMIFGATFDMFDGRVARITNRTSRSGAFFDAVMDRFGEGVCMLGLALHFRDHWLLPVIVAGLVGSLLVSYTKARAEAIGVDCNVGTMQRPERIVALGVASVMDPLANLVLVRWWATPEPVLIIAALCLIAIMTNATAVYRMIYVMNKLDTADRRERESIPQILTKLGTPEGRVDMMRQWEETKRLRREARACGRK